MPSKFDDLPFDQYSRQMKVKRAIELLRSKPNSPLKILDVGGYKGVTKKLHSTDDVTVLDVFDVTEKDYVKGDARALEFKDDTFDVVVGFDVLEHVPKEDRTKVLNECVRVAKQAVIFAFPNQGEVNEQAEAQLNELYKDIHNEPHPWLKEHIAYGLPDSQIVKKEFIAGGMQVVVEGSNCTDLWMQMQGAIFAATKYPEALKPLKKLNTLYNSTPNGDTHPTLSNNYRHIVYALKSKKDADKLSRRIEGEYISTAEITKIKRSIVNYFVEVAATLNEYKQKAASQGEVITQLERRITYLEKRISAFEKMGLVWAAEKSYGAYKRIKSRKANL